MIQGMSWEIGLEPVSAGIEAEPSARPAAVLIVANGLVIASELVMHPPSELSEIGEMLAEHVEALVRESGHIPPDIGVRFPQVADVLRQRLAPLGIGVRCEERLPQLDDAAMSLRQAMMRLREPVPAVSFPSMWAGWGLPDDDVASIFRAAAHYYRVHPWTVFENEHLLELEFPGGSKWYASVLGAAGQEYGLVLYQWLAELVRLFEGEDDDPRATMLSMEGMILSLSFDARSVLPKPMRREIADRGWPVAGPRAYPMLWTTNTPGGGLTRAQANELAGALRAIAEYSAEVARADSSGEKPDAWRDEKTGIVVDYIGSPLLDPEPLWDPPLYLTPSLPEGPGARPGALLDPEGDPATRSESQFAVLDRFRNWLGESGAPKSRVDRDVHNADAIVRCLVDFEGTPLAAITEYDLRITLFDLYIRKFNDTKAAVSSMRTSLRPFFRFLAEREGIECPWAEKVLREKKAFESRVESFPGGFFWDPGVQAWQTELYLDLQYRAMIPDRVLSDTEAAPAAMSMTEDRLTRQLHREWLIWRDELIRGGVTDPETVMEHLTIRQRAWERERRADLGGKTAREVVAEERRRVNAKELPPPFQ